MATRKITRSLAAYRYIHLFIYLFRFLYYACLGQHVRCVNIICRPRRCAKRLKSLQYRRRLILWYTHIPSLRTRLTHAHTHTYIYRYIYRESNFPVSPRHHRIFRPISDKTIYYNRQATMRAGTYNNNNI